MTGAWAAEAALAAGWAVVKAPPVVATAAEAGTAVEAARWGSGAEAAAATAGWVAEEAAATALRG